MRLRGTDRSDRGMTLPEVMIASSVLYNTSGDPIAGFKQAVYAYDQRLNVYPPPMYPVVQDGSLKVDTWIEDKSFAQ
jgi:hypothetical protein